MIRFLRLRHVDSTAWGVQLDLDARSTCIFGERDLRMLRTPGELAHFFHELARMGAQVIIDFRVTGRDRAAHV